MASSHSARCGAAPITARAISRDSASSESTRDSIAAKYSLWSSTLASSDGPASNRSKGGLGFLYFIKY
ncbi:hypothetical protein M408DRAFT_332253 [Serendipita vermifera MAFF 305830]|uniref:Uncharacterized protein n=1 Tax=Serendipita vermifera MAFF 305830 TaxID=933852 RepID=A0A0C3AG92_SERVB|nr:hypothetical protein M408DRAFT_332253 [Serendipita vermifera MAFF 305830]